jgi:Uma2 family endonuclease
MLKTAAGPLTVADYRELPEGPPYYQLIAGDLYRAPSPDLFHQDILGNLHFILRLYLERHPVGTVHLAPSDVQLSGLNVHQPDLYFVSNARKSVLTKQGAEGAPDLVVEILSPQTAKRAKGVKRQVCARTGVEELGSLTPTGSRFRCSVWRSLPSRRRPFTVAGRSSRRRCCPA